MKVGKHKFLLLLVIFLASCVNTKYMEELENIKAEGFRGKVYEGYLSTHYMEFAKKEYDKKDYASYQKFVEKALRVAKGEEVYPEDPELWGIDELAKPELIYARRELMDLILNKELVEVNAGLAANAQFNYDCWVEEVSENWQENDINDCKFSFQEAVRKLQRIKKYKLFEEEVYAKAQQQQLEMQKQLFKKEYIVFFDQGKKETNKESEEVWKLLVEEIKAQNTENYKITIKAYTDNKGSRRVNEKLAQNRANFVKQYLVTQAIKGLSIATEFYTAEQNLFNLNNKDLNSRRAEIIIEEQFDPNKYPMHNLENSETPMNNGEINIKQEPVNLFN